MNSKQDVIRRISSDTKLPTGMVKEMLDSLEKMAADEIAEHGEFQLKNIVTITNRVVPRRIGRDPMTGERRWFPAVRTLVPRTARTLKRALSQSPLAHNC